MSGVLSKGMFVVALVVALAGVVVVGGMVWLRTPWGHEFVRGQIESRLDAAVHGSVRLGGVEGDVLTGIVLHDLVIADEDGVPLLVAETARARYSLRPFLDKRIAVDEVRLIRPEIRLVRGADERWNFQRMFARDEPSAPGPPGWGSWVRIGTIEIEDGLVDVEFANGGWPVLDWQANEFRDLNGSIEVALNTRDRNLRRFAGRDLSFHLTGPDLQILDLDGEGILTPDSLALKEIHLTTPGTELSADGHLTLGGADSLALVVDAPRISLDEAQRLFPHQVRIGGSGSFDGRVTGPAGNPSLEIAEFGVETDGSRVSGSGRIASLANPVLELDLVADPLAPSDVEAYVPAWPIAVPLSGPVRIEGPPRQLAIDTSLSSPAGGLAAAGTLDLRSGLAYDLAGTARGLDVGRLIGRPTVDLTLTGNYRIDGRGTSERELDALVAVELGRSRVYRWDVMSGSTRGRLIGREYRADTLQVRLPQTVMRGSGTFGLARNGRIDGSADIESEDLGEVWPGIGEISTRARADLELAGTYRDLDVTGDLVAADLVYGGFTADSFMGDIQLTGVGGPFDLQAQGTFHRMSMAGVDADSAGVVLDYAESSIQLTADLDMAGEASANLAGDIDFSGPVTETRLTSLVYRTPDGTWQMAEGSELALASGQVRAREFRITQDGQTLRLDGVFGIDGQSDLAFAAENIQLEDVARLTGQPPGDWQGIANVTGTLRGTRLQPLIDVSGEVSSGMLRGFQFQRITGQLSYEDALADIDLTIATPTEEHRLVLTGTAPIDLTLASVADRLPERPVDLQIRGENTDLTILSAIIPGLTDLAGPVDIQVDISGTSESPRFSGAAVLQGGTLTIAATGVTYEDLHGNIAFDNDEITITELRGTDGGRGTFEIGGRVAMENLRLGSLDLELTATDLQVIDLSRQDVQVHATIALTGTTDAPVMRGRLVVDEAIYRMPETSNKEVIDLDEAVIYVDIPGVARPDESIERSPSLWDRSRLDLEVQVTDDAILTASNMRVEISGDLSLFKPAESPMPSLSGTLQVRRGYYEEFGKRFTIEGGEVFFYGTPELNPGLHIVASNTVEGVQGIGDVLVQITVGGTLQNPTIDLASTPPYDKSEIIALALFGTPTPSAGQQGQFSETVRDLVTGTAASSLLKTTLTSELNLDVFEISQRQLEEGDSATLFRVGKFISPDVYVSFEQQVGGEEDHQAVGLRYQMTDLFTLEATVGTRESGVDLFWEYTY